MHIVQPWSQICGECFLWIVVIVWNIFRTRTCQYARKYISTCSPHSSSAGCRDGGASPDCDPQWAWPEARSPRTWRWWGQAAHGWRGTAWRPGGWSYGCKQFERNESTLLDLNSLLSSTIDPNPKTQIQIIGTRIIPESEFHILS